MYTDLKRTWAEIDLSALEHNYKTLKKRVQTRFLGVVKADAYGHGAVEVSRRLQELGVDYLAVSSLDEARELRYNGIYCPILILGHTPANQVPMLIANNITQAVSSEQAARDYEQQAARLGATLKVHIKLDTGMSRLGFVCADDAFDETVAAVRRTGLRGAVIYVADFGADEETAAIAQRLCEEFGVTEWVPSGELSGTIETRCAKRNA